MLTTAAEHAVDDPEIFVELGCLHRRLGRKAEAMKSVRLDPGQAQVWPAPCREFADATLV
jgi:hypothetical protein